MLPYLLRFGRPVIIAKVDHINYLHVEISEIIRSFQKIFWQTIYKHYCLEYFKAIIIILFNNSMLFYIVQCVNVEI